MRKFIDGWLKPADAKRSYTPTHTVSLQRDTTQSPVRFTTIPTMSVLVRKIGHRKFIASIQYKGERDTIEGSTWLHSEERDQCTASQARTAIKLLEEKLKVLNAVIPKWNIVLQDETQNVKSVHLNEHELAVIEPEEVVMEMPKIAKTVSGWITPETDLDEWVAAYEAATRLVWPGLEVENMKNLSGEAGKMFRESVIRDMRSVGKVSPWDTNSEGKPWHFVARVKDPTSFGARPGDGDRRIHKDINGLKRYANGDLVQPRQYNQNRQQQAAQPAVPGKMKRFGLDVQAPQAPQAQVEQTVQTVQTVQEKASVVAGQLRRFSASESKPVVPALPKKYEYLFGTEEQRSLAKGRGNALKKQAQTCGFDEETQLKFYMIGVCVTLRSMNLPSHLEFEAALKEMGVEESYLDEQSRAA